MVGRDAVPGRSGRYPYFNRVEPLVLGMPLILAWIVLWIVLTAVIMAIIYLVDPANGEVQRGPK